MYVCIGIKNMEISWNWSSFYLTLLFIDCCIGFPVNSEDNSIGGHSQLLTNIAAILFTVGTIIILAGCLCCQRRKGFQEFHNTPIGASTVANLEQGHINPIANGEFTIFTPLHPPINNNIFMLSEQGRRIGDVEHIDVSRWFDGARIDFPREKLKYIRELGNGQFGKVVEGAAQDLDSDRTWTPVVVRILDITSSPRDRLSFLHNALFYLAPGHPNILALKGQCLRSAPLLVLQELCTLGDLKSRLRTVGSEDKILQWCCQLTSALKHLHENNFIHPDLAARNCLLSNDLTLKLGDYSLSISKYPEDYYKNGEPLIPVRWRSPESLICTPTTIQPRPLTKEANVWTLGIVMWEICENGSQPYGFLSDDDVISRVFGPESLRLDGPSKPQMYSDYIFRLIKMCWSNKESRPKVAQIDFMLTDLYQVHRNTHEQSVSANSDFDQRWESLKPNIYSKTDNYACNIEMVESTNISRKLSPSLNNLHGSLDNISCMSPLATGSDDLLKTGIDLPTFPKSELNSETTLHFKLGSFTGSKADNLQESPIPNDSLTDSLIFKQPGSSGSDTEEENWRKKVERGAYSEKVRLKSRSVADLMVLTHVDYSESESETPMPSIDYKSNRVNRKSNLENTSLNFSSEGNLLSLEDTFEKELKKMQVERRDSLLFVPDNKSQNNANLNLLRELNSTSEIKPPNQIYNIFNMSIDKYHPHAVSDSKLHFGGKAEKFNTEDIERTSNLSNTTFHNGRRNSDLEAGYLSESGFTFKKKLIAEKLKNCEFIMDDKKVDEEEFEMQASVRDAERKCIQTEYQPKNNLPDILASLDEDHGQANVDLLESNLIQVKESQIDNESYNIHEDVLENNESHMPKDIQKLTEGNGDNVETKESQIVPDLYSENVETSISVNSFLSENHSGKSICDEPISRKMEVFTEQLLPEIKHQFIKGPNIMEAINSIYSLKTNGKGSRQAVQEHDSKWDYSSPSLSQICLDVNKFLNMERNAYVNYSNGSYQPSQNEDFDHTPTDEGNCNVAIASPLEVNETFIENVDRHNNNLNQEEQEMAVKLESDSEIYLPKVDFDVSDSQQESKPNLLTHVVVFSSTPFGKKSSLSITKPPCLNVFDNQPDDSKSDLTYTCFPSVEEDNVREEDKLNYSLETWDNFLGKSFDTSRESNDNFFDSFTSEPQSMLFLNEDSKVEYKENPTVEYIYPNQQAKTETFNECELVKNDTFIKDGTFVIEDGNKTFVVEAANDGTFVIDESLVDKNLEGNMNSGQWETGGGWFLHPQSNSQLTGDIEPQPSTSKGNYIRYGMDDEVVSAIRNELLAKLPQAQSAPQENIKEEEEWNQTERNEVFLKYNAYNTMLSPIPEENSFDLNDDEIIITTEISPKYEDSDSDWSDELPPALSSHTIDSVSIKNDHTASQSSCCSNDTLFNFDDFASVNEKEPQNITEDPPERQNITENHEDDDDSVDKTLKNNDRTDLNFGLDSDKTESEPDTVSASTNQEKAELCGDQLLGFEGNIENSTENDRERRSDLNDFLNTERNHSSKFSTFSTRVVAPLPSPEDKPWKSLPASLLTFNSIQNTDLAHDKSEYKSDTNEHVYSEPEKEDNAHNLYENLTSNTNCIKDMTLSQPSYENIKDENTYENLNIYDDYKFPFAEDEISNIYENVVDNTSPYVNVIDTGNSKSDSVFEEDHDILGVLTDIRFSGPIDSQLMSTSFSESNEAEEQDWESGSDTRSSSSGEFIWKEGEHEESLKALKAVPHDMLEDIQPMGDIVEESTERDISTSSSEEEGDNLEFVPSAWDKFATPTKSALRSPEKSLDRTEIKKSKGVWFKKQKYHCVYEYPREPESPVLQSQDLWKPQIDFVSFADWEFDPEICLPPPTAESDLKPSNFTFKPKINNSRRSLYYLTSPIDFQGDGSSTPRTPDYDCVVPSSRAVDDSVCSQFFPGASSWMENITPDSGLEDGTPVSESSDFPEKYNTCKQVVSLRKLAEQVVNKKKNNRGKKDVLGGLRHTRSQLKLDLPPSPSAFTSGKSFIVEPLQELEVIREKPAFSTFGKSRFLVQHVDTPTGEDLPENKNVCFDVLPYKPINIIPIKNESILYEQLNDNFAEGSAFTDKKGNFIKGEASLLDSADEDSGIESSTLERKSRAIQRDNVMME